MSGQDRTFFHLFKARWNRENMSSAFKFPWVMACIILMVLQVAFAVVLELVDLIPWLLEMGEGVKFSWDDYVFYNSYTRYHYVDGGGMAVEYGINTYYMEIGLPVLLAFAEMLPFAILLLLACRKVHGKVLTEEDIPFFTKALAGRSRLASVSGFLALAAVVPCARLVYTQWKGVPVSEYESAMLIDSESLSAWYFVLTLLVGIVSAILSARVYFHIGKVLKDDAYGRGEAIENCETGARILSVAFAVLIFVSALTSFSGSCYDTCASLIVIDPAAVCSIAAGIMILILNRHRAILAVNCIDIAGRIVYDDD